jgi:hypothetical protein
MRIEFTERYVSKEDRELYEENMAMQVPVQCYKYRRIYPHLDEVEYPIEIPGDKDHCEILFRADYTITVRGNFDDICQAIDDREAQASGEGEFEEGRNVENTV